MPNPSQAGQPVVCTATQTGGYTVSSDQSPVTVNSGASIVNNGDALTVSIPPDPTSYYRSATIAVQGSITSSGGNGVLVTSGGPSDSGATIATITVAAGGSISGMTGIAVTTSPGPYAGPVSASLDNAGAITGTAGPALATSGNGNFTGITNEASGSLGAVAASFNSLANHGIIDGGASSAVNNTSPYNFASVFNDGSIVAEGAAATVQLNSGSSFTNSGAVINSGGGAAVYSGANVFSVGGFTNQAGGTITGNGSDVVTGNFLAVTNSGSIANSGSGQAVSGNMLTLMNNAGATIDGGSGGIAVNGSTGLALVNAGTINGSVLAGSAANYGNVSVDSSQGTINGNVTFGGGNNTLVAQIVNGALQTGITGTITGGAGSFVSNTLNVTTIADATLISSITLPTNFTQVTFVPGSGTTLTLGNGFSSAATIMDNGPGTLTNATTLSGSGQIVSVGGNAGTFDNEGTISSANPASAAAISLSQYAVLENSGSITATGDAVSGYGNGVFNSGTIMAGGTAVSAFVDSTYQNGGFANSGTISSTGGTAVALSLSCTCSTASNSGTISGAVTGLQLGVGIFNNSGTITATGYGIAVNSDVVINNLAGGIITGGAVAIGDPNFLPGSIVVSNAGTINGNVDLAGGGYTFVTNSFDAAPGGVLNGNLTLGSGDTLIADVVNTGSGSFAGITGTVTANDSNLVYNVSADASVAPVAPAGFASVGYQLYNNATLTTAAGSSTNVTLGLAGVGTVNLDGTIATTNQSALQTQGQVTSAGYAASSSSALAITNNGVISAQFDNASPTIQAVVGLNYGGTLVNNGTITGTSTTGLGYDDFTTVFAPSALVNSGTIQGTGLAGVTIGNSSGNGAAADTLTNTGTIVSDQNAVFVIGAVNITNSGSIASTGANGIYNPEYYDEAQVTNLAGGTIAGSSNAILMSGGIVSNAGTINGNVDLTYSLFGGAPNYPGTYYDMGGTLDGNLTLASNGALVIDLARQGAGPLGGVTGTISANGGSLIYEVNASATTAGIPNDGGFGSTGYLLANNSTLTFAAGSQQATTVALAGAGSVILNGTIGTADQYAIVTQPTALLAAIGDTGPSNALTITNNGTITTTADANFNAPAAVMLAAGDTLINNGAIGITDRTVLYYTDGAVTGGLSVTNTGSISGTNVSAVLPGTALVNSGTITSNVNAISLVGFTTIANSGTISSTGAAAIGGNANFGYYGAANVTNLATGVITGAPDAIEMFGGVVVNAGTINGNVNLAMPYNDNTSGGYYADGGTLNGDLTLAPGQVLLVNDGPTAGAFGGVNGTVNANGAALLYAIGSDTTATPAAPNNGFGAVGYQLSNNATVTVASGTTLATTLGLAGTGSAVLNGTIATADQPAIQSLVPFALINTNASTALTITNNGTITTTIDIPSIDIRMAVSLGGSDTLINNGAISLTEIAGLANIYDTAVTGGKSVINAGTITGSGASGIQFGFSLSGIGGYALTNSGTIASDQYAVLVGGGAVLSNNGTIVSTGKAAISSSVQYTNNATIANLAGGTITGAGDAIDLYGGIVSNAGTINGNVNLGYSQYGDPSFANGAFLNAGGTLNGNLTLVADEALLTPLGSYTGTGFTGINGTVNANGASLVYTVANTATTAVAPVAGFGDIGYNLANNATLTLTADSLLTATLDLSGAGTVNIAAAITTVDAPAIASVVPPTASGTAPPNALTIDNSGNLTTTLDPYAYYSQYFSHLTLVAVALANGDTLINTGTVSLVNASGFILPGANAVTGGAALINSGTITATGANAVLLGAAGPSGGAALSLTNSGGITSDQVAVVTTGPAVIINSGTIAGAEGALLLGGLATIANSGNIISSNGVAIADTAAGTQIINQAGGIITGNGDAIDLLGGSVSNAGTINGNIDLAFGTTAMTGALGGGYFATGGTLNGNLTLGQGETLVTGLAQPGAGITGTVTGGGGALIYNVTVDTVSTAALPTGFNSISYQLFGSPTLTLSNASNLSTTLGLAGSGAVVFDGTIATTDAPALQSQPLLTASGFSAIANTLAITNRGMISATFDAPAAIVAPAAVILGSGDMLANAGSIASQGGVAVLAQGAIHLANLADGTITSTGDAIDSQGGIVANAGTITGNVNFGYAPGNSFANATPAVYIADGGTLNGNLAFAGAHGGNELIETGSGFGVTGTIIGGAGTNLVGHLRTASATIALGAALPTGFAAEFAIASGAGTIVTLTGSATSAANIYVGGNGAIVNQANTSGIVTGFAASGESYYASQNATLSAFTNQAVIGGVALATSNFTNTGTIVGNVTITATRYALADTVGGSITGNIIIAPAAPAAGASGSIAIAGNFVGNVDGGAGAATNLATSGGTAAQPIAFGAIANIAGYDETGGFVTLAGTASVMTAAIDRGTFVSLVGSTLNAGQINVAAGASFASGGTVNGNLAVSGTLHVGASPDTLTVNGNVAIASGSTSVFEVSPTASSKLVVSGMATIATNTTLQVVQLQPIAPGTAIELIDATGGISGSFTNLSGISGALVERGNQLDLLALFDGGQAANPQVANGVAYLNALIVSGAASPALLAALPVLQTSGGAPSTAAFARLTPQAYATATQIGVENALILSRAARDIGWDAVHSGNLFTFGQALGSWRGFAGDGARGVSDADLSGYGFIGGIGAGSNVAGIAAFGGYLDQSETIAGLAAHTHAKGFVSGVTGHLASGRTQLNLSVIYDDAHASTQRLSPDDLALSGNYTLHSWTADAEASTSFGFGNGWSAHPHVGATWVWTRRGGAVEDNASAFALTVAGDHHDAGFVDGGLRLASPQGEVGQVAGFLDLGARYQIQGRATDAVAGLGVGPVALLGYGVSRRPVGATLESGATYRATEAISLFVTGSGELSRGDSSGSVTGGIKLRF